MRAKPNKLVLSLSALSAGLAFYCGAALASDPLMDRDGRTFSVTIDGVETKRTAPKKIRDVENSEAYETFWNAMLKEGAHCFVIQPKDKRLGAPERITLLIHEIRPDRPYNNWKSYESQPSTTEHMGDFLTAKGYCPSEYTLTERLRFPALPAGEYVFRLAYWGVGNWDRQDILVTITK